MNKNVRGPTILGIIVLALGVTAILVKNHDDSQWWPDTIGDHVWDGSIGFLIPLGILSLVGLLATVVWAIARTIHMRPQFLPQGLILCSSVLAALIGACVCVGAIMSHVNGCESSGGRYCSCLDHLRQIDAAKEQFAMEPKLSPGTLVTTNDLMPFVKSIAVFRCPNRGEYILGVIGKEPECTEHRSLSYNRETFR